MACFQEYIVAPLDQAILRLDVGIHALPFLGWIDEVHVFGVDRSPLLGCWTSFAIGLGEQLA